MKSGASRAYRHKVALYRPLLVIFLDGAAGMSFHIAAIIIAACYRRMAYLFGAMEQAAP